MSQCPFFASVSSNYAAVVKIYLVFVEREDNSDALERRPVAGESFLPSLVEIYLAVMETEDRYAISLYASNSFNSNIPFRGPFFYQQALRRRPRDQPCGHGDGGQVCDVI